MGWQGGDIAAFEQHFAGGLFDQAGQRHQGTALASTVGANQGGDLALAQFQVNAAPRFNMAVLHRQAADAQDWGAAHAASPVAASSSSRPR